MIFDSDNWQEIIYTLKQNKLRSFLTAFGVFWGLFMLIIMLGAGKGLKNGAMDDFTSWATNIVFIWTRPTTLPYKGMPRGRRFNLTNEDMTALSRQIPEIQYIAPRNQLGGYQGVNNIFRGLKFGAFNVYGDYPELIHIQQMKIESGRFIDRLDMLQKRKIAVIGAYVRDVLFSPNEDPVGQYIKIKGVYFKVVGVFNSLSQGDKAQDETQAVFVPFTTLQQAFNLGDTVGWISLTSQPNVRASVVEQKAIALLAKRHQVSPKDTLAFGSGNMEKEFLRIKNLFIGIDALIWFVGTFTLLAGVIGVSNIMLIIVKERTREIGIKRAIGATPFSILGQMIMESISITLVAGYLGLFCAVVIVEAVSSSLKGAGIKLDYFKNPEIDFTVAIVALGVLIISGAISGLIPGLRAIHIKPVEAIRSE